MTKLITRGPSNARIMIVGDAPYGSDAQTLIPFTGAASQVVPVTLHGYGCVFNACYSLYILSRPLHPKLKHGQYLTKVKKRGHELGWQFVDGYFVEPGLLDRRQALLREIESLSPDLILTCGEIALWAVTGQQNIPTCRGSIFEAKVKGIKTVCTLSPMDLNLDPSKKDFFERDIQRAVTEFKRGPKINYPEWQFLLQASFDSYVQAFASLEARLDHEPLYLALDIETIRKEIACVGLAWSRRDALCLPIRTSREYWSLDQELALITAFQRVVEHPNARIVTQNGLYDLFFLAAKWGVVPRLADDTMDMQHVLFPGLEKALHILASVYCDFYQYWKDELDDYKTAPKDDNKFFAYNCRDCCYTLEVRDNIEPLLQDAGLWTKYRGRMDRSFWTILRANLRGIRVNNAYRAKVARELLDAGMQRETFLNEVIGRPFNPRSTKQMQEFFWNEMGVAQETSRTTGKPSLGAEILVKMHERYPLLGPVADTIIEMRSIGTFIGTFIKAELDYDGRMRTAFALTGPETFRLASRENPFGRGANLQNIPSGDRSKTGMKMPNIRTMYVPDPGYEIFDIDLAGADAQVVAWEADDARLKEMFRKGIKVHAENAKELYGGNAGPDGKREPYYTRTKQGVHLTNYGGWPGTMAKALGITVNEADKFQKRWFEICPGVKRWHERVERELQETRTVTNRFGYRKIFFGRIDKSLPEALAWGPQSTVAIITLEAMDRIDMFWDLIIMYLQVHDSLVFGAPVNRPSDYISRMLADLRIPVPFDDPLIIPFGCNSSTLSWGDCKS